MVWETDEMWVLNRVLYVIAAVAILVIWMIL
jgi:hypothetical protein